MLSLLKKMGHVVCDAVVKRVSVTKKPIFTTVRKTTTLGRVVFHVVWYNLKRRHDFCDAVVKTVSGANKSMFRTQDLVVACVLLQ